MNEGFILDPRIAMIFFRFCQMYKIDRREDRVLVLRELTKRKKAKYIRDIKPLLVGKRVLRVGFKPPHNDGPEHYCGGCKPCA